jgi:hypothetical protein
MGDEFPYLTIGHETYNSEAVLAHDPAAIVFVQPYVKPFKKGDAASVGMPAESKLLDRLQTQGGYVALAPEVTRGMWTLMLLKPRLAEGYQGETWPVQQLEYEYKSPDEPYKWLTTFR